MKEVKKHADALSCLLQNDTDLQAVLLEAVPPDRWESINRNSTKSSTYQRDIKMEVLTLLNTYCHQEIWSGDGAINKDVPPFAFKQQVRFAVVICQKPRLQVFMMYNHRCNIVKCFSPWEMNCSSLLICKCFLVLVVCFQMTQKIVDVLNEPPVDQQSLNNVNRYLSWIVEVSLPPSVFFFDISNLNFFCQVLQQLDSCQCCLCLRLA